MAKHLPFFKFDCNDFLTGKIQLCDMQTQGIFINLCALTWRENGTIKVDRFLSKKLKVSESVLDTALKDLTELEVIIVKNGILRVKFLDRQLREYAKFIRKCSLGGKKSARIRKVGLSIKNEERRKKNEIKETILSNSKEKAADDLPIASGLIEEIFMAHPKRIAPNSSRSAIVKALQHASERDINPHAEAQRILSATRCYAETVAAWPKTEKRYITNSRKWFEGACYDEDPTVWERTVKEHDDQEASAFRSTDGSN